MVWLLLHCFHLQKSVLFTDKLYLKLFLFYFVLFCFCAMNRGREEVVEILDLLVEIKETPETGGMFSDL